MKKTESEEFKVFKIHAFPYLFRKVPATFSLNERQTKPQFNSNCTILGKGPGGIVDSVRAVYIGPVQNEIE